MMKQEQLFLFQQTATIYQGKALHVYHNLAKTHV